MISTHPIRIKYRRSRLVLGFYGSVEHAEEALREVRKNHFRRAGIVHRADDGSLKFLHDGLLPYSRAAAAIASVFVVVLFGSTLRKDLSEFVVAVVGGFLITLFGSRWLMSGRRKNILRNCGRFVLPGESVVVVQETEDRTSDVLAVLRRITLQSLFVIRPRLGFSPTTRHDETSNEPVTMANLPDCAAELAASHMKPQMLSLDAPEASPI